MPIRKPNYQGPFGNTLLHGAVVSGDAHEVKRLLDAGADPKIRNRDGRTALHAALLLHRRKIYAMLRAAASRVRRIRR